MDIDAEKLHWIYKKLFIGDCVGGIGLEGMKWWLSEGFVGSRDRFIRVLY